MASKEAKNRRHDRDGDVHPESHHEGTPSRSSEGKDSALVARLRRRIFDLHTVFDIAGRFQAILDTDVFLKGILLTAISHLGVGAAAIAVAEPGHPDHLTLIKSKGWDDRGAIDWRLSVASPLARQLVTHRHPLRIEEVLCLLPADSPDRDRLRRAGCHLIAPMVSRQDLRGVLYTSARLNGRDFNESDLQFLGLLLEQLSVSLDNTLLHESEKRTADQLLQAHERLAQSEKLAAMGHLSATVAHEVNNPLGVIKNYVQLLRPALAESSESLDKLEMIGREVDRMVRFVRELLGVFSGERKTPEAIAVGPILSDVTRFVEPELTAARIRIAVDVPNDLPDVWAEPEPLRQVFMNLALNARDAMPQGGHLNIVASHDHDWVEIRFIDEGQGIDPAIATKLFKPFTTTKTSGEGAGLGLSICQSIINGFGGTISARNCEPPQTGAAFGVKLRTAFGRAPVAARPEHAGHTLEEQ